MPFFDDLAVAEGEEAVVEVGGHSAVQGNEREDIADVDWAVCGGGIDVAVLDLTMPHKSGRETARAIRAESPELPIVLSSGYPEENEVDRVEGTGPIAFLQKPYANDDLLALIREALA